MLDGLANLLKLKLILHWLFIYIIVNILEFIVIHLLFKWMFKTHEKEDEPVR